MPVTPKFTVSQNDTHLLVIVATPYVRPSTAECLVESNTLHFYCKPYLLRIEFTGELDDDDDKLEYSYDMEVEHGTWRIEIPKRVPGTHFADLDLISLLLTSQKKSSVEDMFSTGASTSGGLVGETDALASKLQAMDISPAVRGPLIQVIDSQDFDTTTAEAAGCDAAGDVAASVEGPSLLPGPVQYGFNNKFAAPFLNTLSGEVLVLDLPQPDHVPAMHRTLLRTVAENADFDAERYLADFAGGGEDPLYGEAIALMPSWLLPGDDVEWSGEEQEEMRNLRCGELLIDGRLLSRATAAAEASTTLPAGIEHDRLAAGLVGILAAYAYDFRITAGENNVESAWTMSKLSPLLSWLDDRLISAPVHGAMLADLTLEEEGQLEGLLIGPSPVPLLSMLNAAASVFLRRALTYPYMRRWDLGILCLNDVATMLLRGKRHVLKSLLAIRRCMAHNDQYYMLNTLYIDDFCAWTTFLPDAVFPHLGVALAHQVNSISKGDVSFASWCLEEVEALLDAEEQPSE